MNTLIVDDEKPARDELAFLLKSFPEVSVVGQGKNGLDAVSLDLRAQPGPRFSRHVPTLRRGSGKTYSPPDRFKS
jgi:chemotaxis response regulator CheB